MTIDKDKIDSIVACYVQCRQNGLSDFEAEMQVRKTAPDNGCDTRQITLGLERARRSMKLVTIRNINEHYGADTLFTADTLEDAVEQMQTTIRACGEDFADVVVTETDYDVVGMVELGDLGTGHVWFTSVAHPAGCDLIDRDESPVPDGWERLEGQITDNQWEWDGRGNARDECGSTVMRIVAFVPKPQETMTIKLWSGVNNESWRELFNDVDDMDESEQQQCADELASDVFTRLSDAGHDVKHAYQQCRGIYVICQTPAADDIVRAAIEVCKFQILCNR